MKILTYISLLITFSLNAQTTIECAMTLRDTLVTQYVDFGSCSTLVMADGSYLRVEYLQGSGEILYINQETTNPIIEFVSCYPYQEGNVYIDNSITIIVPSGCETLSIEDVNPNDLSHLNSLYCEVYNVLGQRVHKGKFEALKLTAIGIYFVKFEYFNKKIIYDGNGYF